MLLLDLPEDILSIIFRFLRPNDFLAFCQVSKDTYADYRQDSLYWRIETSNTFRLPISPLLAADGPRWYWLYKRLRTQTQLYTWGQGLAFHRPGSAVSLPRRVHPQMRPRSIYIPTVPPAGNWPTPTHVPDEVGVIADLQCGGWSTTILSADGKLYTAGSIDTANAIFVGRSSTQFSQLEYLTQSSSAVRQFSSGRAHILALTDDGDIISWDRSNAKGLKVFSNEGRDFGGKPTRVAAGWGESSAYVPERGIIYWAPIPNNQQDEMLDGVHIEGKVVPGTARRKTDTGYIEVVKHIALEGFVVWITSDSKIYACTFRGDSQQSQPDSTDVPFEVPGYSAPNRQLLDVQGQFQRFGVFTASGEVLAGDTDYLRQCAAAAQHQSQNESGVAKSEDWSDLTTLLASRPQDVRALQNSNVIALAFGDHHYHALHANGKITSYGRDSQSCGSLGLCGPETGGRFRGVRRERPGLRTDALLLPVGNLRGRQVWFGPEQKDWLDWMEKQLHEPHMVRNGLPGHKIWDDDAVKQAAFSEWVEQEGRHWEEGPVSVEMPRSSSGTEPRPVKEENTDDYANLGAYFPIAIAAAGWHSGALVLVDQDRAHEVRHKWLAPKEIDEHEAQRSIPGAFESDDPVESYVWEKHGFPKVRLPDGVEMPGVGEPRAWRDGMPSMRELGLEGGIE